MDADIDNTDIDDTVIAPVRHFALPVSGAENDTIIRARAGAALGESSKSMAAIVEIPPPTAFYRFVVNKHDPIGLDRPAYIGRRPSPARIERGERPRLVRVPSPLGEVSGTHLELRQQGSTVIATDLRSTNGTVVRMPGSSPVRLRQGESVVVTPGSIVEIGDGNVIEILSVQRAYPPVSPSGERLP